MHIEIDGYDQYSSVLSPENQLKLAGLAATIVGSQLTPYPVQAISIIGHADKALLVPIGERFKKEMEVSIARAKVAESQLQTAITALPGGPAAIPAIQFLTSGVGARELKVQNAQVESEMRKNRRVDITTVDSQGGIIHVLPDWPIHIPDAPDAPLEKVYSIKLLEGVAGAHLFQYTFAVWDRTASRAGVFDYRGVEPSVGVSSPFSSESDWADFLVPSAVTLEEFSTTNNAASHVVGTLVDSFMILNLPRGSVVIRLGLAIGVSVGGGSGLFTLAPSTIKPFNGP